MHQHVPPRARTARILAGLLLAAAQASAQLVFEPTLPHFPAGSASNPRTALGDVDADGDLDVVVGTGDFFNQTGYDVLLGDGAGALAVRPLVLTADVLNGVRLADLDEDGRLDLLSAGGDALRRRAGLGDGTFGAPLTVYVSPSAEVFYLEALELTGDAHLDLVGLEGAVVTPLPNVVTLLPGLGGGSLGAPLVAVDLGAQGPYAARAPDLDGDGVTDLVVAASTTIPPGVVASVAWSFLGTGGGTFGPGAPHVLGEYADVEVAELTGDGRPDLAASSALGVAVKPGQGDGAFGPAKVLELGDFGSGVAVADFDGDGHRDVAAVRHPTRELVVWRGTGGPAFVEGLRLTTADSWSSLGESPLGNRPLAAADMDGDGRPDLVRTSSDNENDKVGVILNHTYGAGEPFLDLGQALPDPPGPDHSDLLVDTPILLADGTLQAGDEVRVRLLRHGVEVSAAWLVLGFAELGAPFQGGTLVPEPDVLLGPFPLGVSFDASVDLSTPMPAGVPPGTTFWMQGWFPPAFAWQDPSATSAVRALTP